MMAIRTIISTLIGLYTSRVVFAQLGDVDYGVYGVVGGILGIMGFLRTSMSGATQRFVTYAIGTGSNEQVSEIFKASFYIHCGIALLVMVVGETFGVWILNNVLNIPPERLDAAWWVLQFSIIASAFSIMQVPYGAVIIAYERMGVYAYFEMAHAVLKLIIVYMLAISSFDKLVSYSFLLLAVTVVMTLSYRIYCIKSFSVCKLGKVGNYGHIKSLLTYSMIDLYGNVGISVKSQGLTYAINIFYGVIYNAASSFALTVSGAIQGFTASIPLAFRPQIVKQYAQGDVASMQTMMSNSLKFTLVVMAIFAIPCYIEADYILYIWLGSVPLYSVEFLRILLIANFLPIIMHNCNAAIHATGNIKTLSYVNGTVSILVPVLVFIVFHFGADVLWGYGMDMVGLLVIIVNAILVIRRLIPLFNCVRFVRTILQCSCIIAGCALPAFYVHTVMDANFFRIIAVTLCYILTIGAASWTILLNADGRRQIIAKINSLSR